MFRFLPKTRNSGHRGLLEQTKRMTTPRITHVNVRAECTWLDGADVLLRLSDESNDSVGLAACEARDLATELLQAADEADRLEAELAAGMKAKR